MKYYLKNSDSCSNGITVLTSPVIYFISGFLVFLVQIYLLAMLKRSRYLASRYQDKQASNSLILPIYYRGVVYLVILGILVGLDDMFVFYSQYVEIICLKWGLYRIISESLAVFLTHNGIGIKALYNSLLIGVSWAIISTVIPVVIFEYYGWKTYLIISSIFILILATFYGIMWLSPQTYIHRRPALITYSRFFCLGLLIFAFAHYLLLFREELQLSCLIEVILAFADLLQPLLIYYAMHQDSRFWQGLFNPSGPGETNTGNLNQPLLGVWELGRETIGVVGDTIADLEQHTVPIIPFGVLRIDTSGYFSGGSARVYKGLLHQEDVAVKILFCIELTPERVVSFCQEASMLHSLQHPNIVHCNGVAVMPPAICLITEWCHHGSLYDLLHVSEYYVRDSSISARYSLSKRSPGQYRTYSRPSLMRMSNTSLDNDELQPSNIPDTLVRLEEAAANENNTPREVLSGSAKSSNSNEHFQNERSTPAINRLGSRVVSMKSGSYIAATPVVNIVLDISTNQVSEIVPGSEKTEQTNTRNGVMPSVITKLKSAASVMQSSLMGFGFGLGNTESANTPEGEAGQSESRSSLLLTGDSSRNSLGFCLPMPLRIKMIRDCCAGVAFLHSRGLMHCDIKSLNFLVTKDFIVKLSDLGEARPYKTQPVDRIKLPKNINWSAPEILMDNGRDVSELSDVWSLAVVAAEILSGEIPFDTQQYRQLNVESFVDALASNIRPTLPPKHIPEDLHSAINSAWNYEVHQRCSAQSLTDVFTEHIKNERLRLNGE